MDIEEIKKNAPHGAKKYNPKTGQYYRGKYISKGFDWVRVYFFPSNLISLNHFTTSKPL